MNPDTVSAWAAVASAVGTALATLAAFRSAGSAQRAQKTADETERRFTLRQLYSTAAEVVIEFRRVEARSIETKRAYSDLFTFSGGSGGSRKALYLARVDEMQKIATELRDHAQLFASPTDSTCNAPIDELDRIMAKLASSLAQMRAYREDLEREHASVEAQNAMYRQRVIQETTK